MSEVRVQMPADSGSSVCIAGRVVELDADHCATVTHAEAAILFSHGGTLSEDPGKRVPLRPVVVDPNAPPVDPIKLVDTDPTKPPAP